MWLNCLYVALHIDIRNIWERQNWNFLWCYRLVKNVRSNPLLRSWFRGLESILNILNNPFLNLILNLLHLFSDYCCLWVSTSGSLMQTLLESRNCIDIGKVFAIVDGDISEAGLSLFLLCRFWIGWFDRCSCLCLSSLFHLFGLLFYLLNLLLHFAHCRFMDLTGQEATLEELKDHSICHPVAIKTKTVGPWLRLAAIAHLHAIIGSGWVCYSSSEGLCHCASVICD